MVIIYLLILFHSNLVLLISVNDPILSPVLATDDVVARYPPVRIIVGDMDPLLGMSFCLASYFCFCFPVFYYL